MKAEVIRIDKHTVRINNGIYTTLRCTKCGQNLPLFVFECPHCFPASSKNSVNEDIAQALYEAIQKVRKE